MRIAVPALDDRWKHVPAKSLFTRMRRPPRPGDGIVTAFRDGAVTLRSNRREDGFTNAVEEVGYQGVRAGDLVIHSMDGFAGAIGVSDSSGKASPVVHCYQPNFGIDARFYAFLLRHLALNGFIVSLAKGIRERSTAFDNEAFRSLVVPLPPPGEQRALADFLDAETALIDALITKKRRLIDLLQVRQTRSLSRLLHCEVKDEDGVFLPSANSYLPLRRVAVIYGGLTVGKKNSGSLVRVPYLRVANVQDGYFDLDDVSTIGVTAEDVKRFVLRAGDVLILEGNGNPDNLGRGAVWRAQINPCLHQNHVHAVRPDTSRLLPEYLAFVMQTEWARHFFTSGSAQVSIATLSQSRLGNLPLPVPDINEQAQLVEQASQRANEVVGMSSALSRQISLLQERRQALITAAVTGQVEIPGAAA